MYDSSGAYDERNLTVVKDNELIQKSRYRLSLKEQKIVLMLISLIKPTDNELNWYNFRLDDFYDVCGITFGGSNYAYAKEAVKKLADNSVWIMDKETGTERLCRWIDEAEINANSGTIRIRLHKTMRPYLLSLKSRYTSYKLIHTLAMTGKYSVRLYELFRSYVSEKQANYSYDITENELKGKVMAENYNTWQHFRDRVIVPALKDINEYGDIEVTMDPIDRYKKRGEDRRLIFRIKLRPIEEIKEIVYKINKEMPPTIEQLHLPGFAGFEE